MDGRTLEVGNTRSETKLLATSDTGVGERKVCGTMRQ
jgi:hypothetical protein